ncbi:glycosyltransferase family protein [Brumimicrobium salinarum]|uniref:hypothetical protein n=1 Tax=Brumimicrobium salinarum TaxID=2058658 RepID=UPI00269AC36D|nr:hypothetical protein [Brumimicrobium salinarum]
MIFSIVKTKTEEKDAQFFDWKNVFGITDDFAFLMAKIVLIIYGVCLLLILFYSILQLILAFKYRASKSRDLDPNKPQKLKFNQEKAPYVTIQIPIYNEFYVAERIIDKVAQIDYPSDRLEIQVLDDSTDETKDVVAKKLQRF